MNYKPKVKICGVKSLQTAIAVRDYGADYVGFIFYEKSKRYVRPEVVSNITNHLTTIKKVGVFVNENPAKINQIAEMCQLDYIQLHGEELASIAKTIKQPIIKAFRYGYNFSVTEANNYPADMILIDSYEVGVRGGTGKSFNWQIAGKEIEQITKPVLIAGGLNVDNVCEAVDKLSPYWVDVSGGLEVNNEKSVARIAEFMQLINKMSGDNR